MTERILMTLNAEAFWAVEKPELYLCHDALMKYLGVSETCKELTFVVGTVEDHPHGVLLSLIASVHEDGPRPNWLMVGDVKVFVDPSLVELVESPQSACRGITKGRIF